MTVEAFAIGLGAYTVAAALTTRWIQKFDPSAPNDQAFAWGACWPAVWIISVLALFVVLGMLGFAPLWGGAKAFLADLDAFLRGDL